MEEDAKRGRARAVCGLCARSFLLSPNIRARFGGIFALLAATAATLAMPIAVRFMIDNGFSTEDASSIDRYFLAMLVVAIVLGLASAMRFYFVSWIGERVTADLRAAVYNHITTYHRLF